MRHLGVVLLLLGSTFVAGIAFGQIAHDVAEESFNYPAGCSDDASTPSCSDQTWTSDFTSRTGATTEQRDEAGVS